MRTNRWAGFAWHVIVLSSYRSFAVLLSPIPLKTPRTYIIIFIIWDAFTGRARVCQQIGVVYTKTGIDFRVFTTLDQKFNLISARQRLERTTTWVHEIMGYYYVFVRSLYLYYVYTRVTNGRSICTTWAHAQAVVAKTYCTTVTPCYRCFDSGGTYMKARIKRRYGKSETTNNNKIIPEQISAFVTNGFDRSSTIGGKLK